jgi:hypothetical protein
MRSIEEFFQSYAPRVPAALEQELKRVQAALKD